MEWYIPITILSGVGLIILSTSNLLIALNNEIQALNVNIDKFRSIVEEKIQQLKKLNYALVLQYISAFSLVVSGILGKLTESETLMIALLLIGVFFLAVSFALLIYYSIKSVSIRQKHLNL